MKIFLGEGDTGGEVFLNLNWVLGKAEFSIKDSDYGDFVIAELGESALALQPLRLSQFRLPLVKRPETFGFEFEGASYVQTV